jgi:OFA family oxalate/formate antiporter-like MFS transporter
VGLIFVSLFRDPPAARATDTFAAQGSKRGLRPSQVVRRPQFYLLWLQLFANAIAGITIISNAVYILHDLTQLPLGDLASLFGLVSVCNAAGRIFWGAVSDRIGCRQTFVVMFVIQAAMLFWLTDVHDLQLALAAFGVILLCCGGGFGTMPAYSAEHFGTRFMGLNYGLILSAWGFAGLVGPLLMARVKDITGSFAGMLPLVGSVLLLSVILPLLTAKPKTLAIWDRPLNAADAHELA